MYRKSDKPWYLICVAMSGKLLYVYTGLSYTILPEIKWSPTRSVSLNHNCLGIGAVLEVILSSKFAKKLCTGNEIQSIVFFTKVP